MTLASGTTIGPYQIVSQLGAGGMGVVYTATDPPVSVLASIPLLLRLQLEFFSQGRQESEVKSQGSG